MKTVKDLCVIQDNALNINVSDQIEQLDQLINDQGDGTAFFEKTFITDGMKAMLTEGIARLAGKSTQALFHLKQAMGGGKTHLLVGFGLLARQPELRRKYIPHITHFGAFGAAKVAAFNGRNTPNQYFWGLIAEQLGKPQLFRQFWEGGPKAPDESHWLELFEGPDPVLVLLDEMPPYFEILNTQQIGKGTVADIATRALANLFSAAGKKSNVCVVVSDLTAAYQTGGAGINHALENARQELGRGEKTITPVDLAGNEIYEILRKRLFKAMPGKIAIDEIAAAFGKAISEASRAKVIGRAAEAIADEISQTYPFHPRLKNLIALFKENEHFRQTRGLMELVSRLLRSVWEREANDVYLIGPQHFDLSIPDVRDKLAGISGMGDVIAKDLWDANGSAHCQVIDAETQNDCARYAANVIFTSSLSTAHNAVKGLTSEEILECALSPFQDAAGITTALEQLDLKAWYLHHAPDGKYYFDRQENLTKLLQDLAEKAPQPKIEEVINNRLEQLFAPTRKVAYEDLLPLPGLSEIEEQVRKRRTLVILPPEGQIPSESLEKFFRSIQAKNNLLVLTGERSQMDSLDAKARFAFASMKAAETRIPKGHTQREELEKKQEQYSADLTVAILNAFDKIVFPTQRPGQPAKLASKPLSQTWDQKKPYNGEEQIENTLAADPLKLYRDVQSGFDGIRDKAQDLLWPQGGDDARWSDVKERATQEPGMPWLPPGSAGLEQVKALALSRGLWEDLGNGYITKRPRPKQTGLVITPESDPDDQGMVRLRLSPQNAGPAPRIYYREEGPVDASSPVVDDSIFTTKALWVEFLVVDTTGQHQQGPAIKWTNQLVIRHKLISGATPRRVELYVAPRGDIWYTLDGSEPRNGAKYQDGFAVGDGAVRLMAFGKAEALEVKEHFPIPAKESDHEAEIRIDEGRPATIQRGGQYKLDSRAKTFELLELGKTIQLELSGVHVSIGSGPSAIMLTIANREVSAAFLLAVLNSITEADTVSPSEPIALGFKKAVFRSGKELREFIDRAGIVLRPEECSQ